MATMNADAAKKINRVAIYHDLVVELGRIELHVEKCGEASVDQNLLARRSKLESALRHLNR